jgi:hypothetical protein
MERLKAAPAPATGSGTNTPAPGEGEKEIELAKAALSVAELDALLAPPEEEENGHGEGEESTAPLPLQSLEFVEAYIPVVDKARDTIITEMESMVRSGLASLNQPLISSSLQTAHNLRLLPDLVSNLVADLNDTVTLRVQRAFDSAAIGREVAGKGELAAPHEADNRNIARDPLHDALAPADGAVELERRAVDRGAVDPPRARHRGRRGLLHQGVHAREGAADQARRRHQRRVPRRGDAGELRHSWSQLTPETRREAELYVLDDAGDRLRVAVQGRRKGYVQLRPS